MVLPPPPGRLLVLSWQVNVAAHEATTVTIRFTGIGEDRTRVDLTHSGWEVFAERAGDMRNGYNQGWVRVFEQCYGAACAA